ncbi:hypothetical protein LINPERHAP2_LOCUS4206, partial [Linum perenne]
GYQIKAFLLVSFTHLGSGISSPSLLPCQISDLRWSSNLFDRAQFSRRSLRPIFIQGPRSSPNQRVTWPQDESPEVGVFFLHVNSELNAVLTVVRTSSEAGFNRRRVSNFVGVVGWKMTVGPSWV